ncbi:MAG: Lrp/AsnC ligand binding domain-containing protein [Nitrososphaerota archaeon]|nr:Lrp/AsnC ligand binding domain-containing protein [Nitrososphaerota archaeon]
MCGMVSACVLIRSEKGRYSEVVERVKQFKEVKRAFPVLGRYDVVVDVEAESFEKLGSTILRIGQLAGVVFTETMVEVVTGEEKEA